ncbi:novel immune-type receptor 4a isoform 4 precursor [Danio rerio]|uniref:Novel immune type receptor 4a n=1 Tax=Danio rerio TaxID=7955 RepID=Q90Z82_DANRE|nr:novel immune-type receptor 4a isoform 4 precursor [Danio rerio]AAK60117.1 novel immune type receptor 4a [Danio rerio]|eukprot:NP_571732.1 novel immune-type receptor 4a isoform 4 precursor [Danio rerio]
MNHIIYVIIFLFHPQVSGKNNCTVDQVDEVLTTQEGHIVLLPCLLLEDHFHRVIWYKQVLGEKPVVIVSSYHHSQPNEFSSDFKETQRFHAVRKADSFNLTIRRTLKSDSGTYFCGSAFTHVVSFGTGTILLVKGSNVTLRCSAEGKTCDKGVQSVYWFRQSSNTTHPGIVYTHGKSRNECADSSDTQSCLQNLAKMSVDVSEAGLYYCSVVTCDEVLFGNGTTLVIEDGFISESIQKCILIGLTVLSAVSLTINILLSLPLRRNGGTPQQIQTNDEITRVQFQNADDINYAALNLSSKRGQRKMTLEKTPTQTNAAR